MSPFLSILMSHTVFIKAAVAGPPSPAKPATSVPAKVVITPVAAVIFLILLPSPINMSPLSATAIALGRVKVASIAWPYRRCCCWCLYLQLCLFYLLMHLLYAHGSYKCQQYKRYRLYLRQYLPRCCLTLHWWQRHRRRNSLVNPYLR